MAYLNGLQSKRKTKEDQGEEFGERKTSIVRCYATLLVHCMTAQMMTAITHVALKAETKCEKTLSWFSFVVVEEKIINKLFSPQCFLWFRVHDENFQLAQQRGFDWFKAQSAMFLTFVLQTCCSALTAAKYLLF